MDIQLDAAEIRILGALIEKEMTTPEYYPLSLNALTNACNQKSNRHPVVSYDETSVEQALKTLLSKGLSRETHTAGSRVTKYLHTFLDRYDLSAQEMAVLCELMLRGPQTVGEIRSRAGRMTSFESLEAAEKTLLGLVEHAPPLVAKLARESGRKECRYAHLLSGGADAEVSAREPAESPLSAEERISRLEEEVSALRADLDSLKQAFTSFREQF